MRVFVAIAILAVMQRPVSGETPTDSSCVCSPAIYVDCVDKEGGETNTSVMYQLRAQLTLLQGTVESLRTQQEILIAEVSNLTAELRKEADPVEHVCPSGYVQFENRCFNFSTDKKTYTDARSACHAAGGRLAMPKDQLTNDFLVNEVWTRYISPYIAWFGLTDQVREGTWVWEDGTPLVGWSDWAPGEPDNYFNSDCAGWGSRSGLKWIDAESRINAYYVCEMRATAL
ncbi:perlucin-like protein [Branchiostoma floridae]|uniref:Perlucin-like protein n=1 Tax=Branchiostoma floridae TaxID=7739 RepID=A0A9J7MAW3_BRAFL|nr:perlucin-like protein [Branchiostoma floridae]